jgi:trans-aconitate 2-methyltransferase
LPLSLARSLFRVQWDAERYQNSHSFVWKYGSSLLDLIDADALVSLASQDSRREIRALDVGCGTGQLTRQLRDRLAAAVSAGSSGAGVRGVRVLGMDLDPSMVESARSSFPSIEFFEGDARSFRLDGPVHLILSNAALHWVPPPDAGRAAESIGLALAPGGQLVAEFGGRGNVRAIVAALRRVFPPPPSEPAPEVWYYPSVAEFSSVLERHGIEVTSASLYDRPTPLEEGDGAMRNWILMFGSKFWEHLSLGDGELESRIDEAVELLRPGLYDPDAGQWTADYRRLRVVGRKLPG